MHQCAPKTALRCHKIGASGAFCEQRYWWQKYEDSFCSLFRRKRASKLGIWLETVASGNTFLRYEQDSRDSILTYKGWRSCILRSDRLRPLARSLRGCKSAMGEQIHNPLTPLQGSGCVNRGSVSTIRRIVEWWVGDECFVLLSVQSDYNTDVTIFP